MADSDRFLPPRAGNAQQQQETLPRAAASRPYALAFANPDMSGGNGGRRNAGIPPFHPNVPPASPSSQLLNPFSRSGAAQQAQSPPQPTARGHSRSLSQPAGFFSLDSLPPLSPSPYRESGLPSPHPEPPPPPPMDIAMEEQALAPTPRVVASTPPATPSSISRSNSGRAAADGLPPRKAHRRSHSDIPFGFADNLAQILGQPPPLPPRPQGAGSADGASKQQGQPVKQEWDWDMDLVRGGNGGGEDRKVDGIDCTDDLIDAYMNFDVLDGLDSSEEKREDMDSRASGTKTSDANSSENESECSVNENASTLRKRSPNSMAENMDVGRRFAAGDFGNARSSRHCRSISMDSFMGKMDFSEDLLKLPPSPGFQPGQLSRNNSLDGNFSMEIGNGGFSGAEMKKIMANAKLAEIAMTDPKRAKRILANRQSAARSKERKMRYISELELKVQTLQTEATTLSAQLTILQRDSAGLTTQNNELKFRLQAMEQQAHLRDALHEALTQEVQRLRLATAQLGDGRSLKSPNPQLAVNTPPFHLHQQLLQSSQQQQQDQQQNRTVSSEAPSKSS